METKTKSLSDALRSLSASFFEIAKALDSEGDAAIEAAPEDELITSEEAAELMRCCRQTVYNRFNVGALRGKYVGGRLLVTASSVESYNKHFNRKLK